MGHFNNMIVGTGKNRREAEADAIDEFIMENGHRHDVRDVSKAKLIKTVPPMKNVEEPMGKDIYIRSVPNEDAPKNEWLEVWEFELHTHA